MGLLITKVALRDFRNYPEFTVEPDPSLTVLVGPNAVGKTNVIEAIQLLTEAESFRRPAWAETVRIGAQGARLSLEAEGDERHLQVDLEIPLKGARRYKINGKPRSAVNRVAGIIPAVVFTPDDLRLVKDSAERRRAALDSLGSQLSPSYARLRVDYDRVLRQRNTALRDGISDPDVMEPLKAQLIDKGAALVGHRMRLFGRLREAMGVVYSGLVETGSLEVEYLPSWVRENTGSKNDDPLEALTRLATHKAQLEKTRGTSLIGPHRDEITFHVDGKEARSFASQGQQRTIALAWKLAEVAVVADVASQKPVLLLDDVMSELDEMRRHALASFVGSAAQTIMTTTNIGYFDDSLLSRAQVVVLK